MEEIYFQHASPILTSRGQSDTDPVRSLRSIHILNFGKDKNKSYGQKLCDCLYISQQLTRLSPEM